MKTGVLCIHGFTGGPFEIEPFADFLSEQTDWIIETPTLPGHGKILELHGQSAEMWMMEAELALKRLKVRTDRVIIVGFSMGGLIALYLSMRYKIDRLVLLSAAVKYISTAQMAEEVRIALKDMASGRINKNAGYHLYEYKFRQTPIRSAIQFLRVVKMVQPYYAAIKLPVFIVQGNKDGVVPPTAAQFIYDQLGSSEKHLYRSETGRHLICYSEDSADWFTQVLQFMQGRQ